jgi:hypothetical protein
LGFHKKTGGTAMSFLAAKITVASLALVAALGAAVISAPAQQQSTNNQGQETGRSTPESEKSTFDPNCITHVCQPPRQMRRVASRESCECKINVIRSGGRTIQVKDCYVALPDNTVYFCKNPFAKGQAG